MIPVEFKINEEEAILGKLEYDLDTNMNTNHILALMNDFKPLFESICDPIEKYISKNLNNSFKLFKPKIYKSIIFIFDKYERNCILLGNLFNINDKNIISLNYAKHSEEHDIQFISYLYGKLFGYRDIEIKDWYRKRAYLNTLNTLNAEELDDKYIKIKTLGDRWLDNALSPASEFNDFYEKEKSKIILLFS